MNLNVAGMQLSIDDEKFNYFSSIFEDKFNSHLSKQLYDNTT